jgi:hypothetical protein
LTAVGDSPSASPAVAWHQRPLPALGPRARRDLAALGCFTLAAVVLLYRLVLNLDRFAPDPGDPLLNSWIMAWDVHALAGGLRHFFDANIFFPYPLTLAYSETLLGDLPLAGPIIALTGNPLLACNAVVLASFIAGGWCMYFAVSRLTGSGWAGLIAGAVYAFGLPRFAALSHVQLLTTQWLPLVVYFADRVLREGRWRHWLGLTICFNLQFLCSYNLGLFMVLTLALLVVAYLIAGLGRPTRRLLAQGGAWLAVTLAVNLPLAAPYFTLSRQMHLQRSLADLAPYSAAPRDYVTADPTHWLYGGLGRTLAPTEMRGGEHFLFLGVMAWALALLGLLSRPAGRDQRRQLAVFGALGAVLIVLSLGPRLGGLPLPYALLFEHLPGFRSIRVPARLVVMVALCVAFLAGCGASHWLPRLGRWRLPVAVAAVLLTLAEAGPMTWPGVIVPPPNEGPAVVHWLAARTDAPVVLELPIPTQSLLQAFTQCTRQYYSTVHWQRTVNGYSGFMTRTYETLAGTSQSFPDAATCAWLQGLRVDLVVLHRDDYEPESWAALQAALPRWADTLRPLEDLEGAQVLQVVLPEWNAGTARPEFGGKLRLLGYAPPAPSATPRTLRLYWQALSPTPACEVVLQPAHGAPLTVPLTTDDGPPPQWPVGEVEVQEVTLPAGSGERGRAALNVRALPEGSTLPIAAGGQALEAVQLGDVGRQ